MRLVNFIQQHVNSINPSTTFHYPRAQPGNDVMRPGGNGPRATGLHPCATERDG